MKKKQRPIIILKAKKQKTKDKKQKSKNKPRLYLSVLNQVGKELKSRLCLLILYSFIVLYGLASALMYTHFFNSHKINK